MRRQRQQVASPAAEGPRLSITPLLLKNLGSRLDPFVNVGDAAQITESRCDGPTHLVPIRVTRADLDGGFLVEGLTSFGQVRAQPCLVFEYTSAKATRELLDAVLRRLERPPPMWLTYSTFHDRIGVDEVIAAVRAEHGVHVQPIMTP